MTVLVSNADPLECEKGLMWQFLFQCGFAPSRALLGSMFDEDRKYVVCGVLVCMQVHPRCALVGRSGAVLRAELGDEIDDHDAVRVSSPIPEILTPNGRPRCASVGGGCCGCWGRVA